MAGAVFRETDVDGVKQRENNEERKSEETGKQIAESVGTWTEINIKAQCKQAQNHNAEPVIPRLVREKIQIQHRQNYQRRDKHADGGNRWKTHWAMFFYASPSRIFVAAQLFTYRMGESQK